MPLPNPNLFKKDQSYDPVYGGLGFGGEEECITQRPTSTALFCISSADRYATQEQARDDSTSPYRFTITKRESLLNGFFTRMALTEIRFPMTLPNVSSAVFTNLLGLDVTLADLSAAVHFITIPDGSYSPPELGALVQAIWNTNYPGFPITVSVTANQEFLIDAGAGNTVVVYPLSTALPSNLPNNGVPPNTYQLCDMMGFTAANFVAAQKQLSDPIGTNFYWTDYVDIVATNLTYNQALKDSSSSQVTRDIIYRIYLTNGVPAYSYPTFIGQYNLFDADANVNNVFPPVAYSGALPEGSRPQLIYRQFQNPKEIRWSKNQPIGQVTFEVYDDKGRCLADLFPVGILNGKTYNPASQSSDWNMTMLVSEN